MSTSDNDHLAVTCFDEAAMHQLFQDVEIAVRQSYEGCFDKRTAIKGLLATPRRDSGHSDFQSWQGQYTPVTFDLDSATMLVLVDVTEGDFDHGPGEALYMAALAQELTTFFSTLVVPAQRSDERTSLAAPGGRKFAAFKFYLIDEPTRLCGH